MKKTVLMALFWSMVFSLTGCRSGEITTEGDTTEAYAVDTEQFGDVKIAETMAEEDNYGYMIEAELKQMADEEFGQDIHDLLAEEWEIYHSLSEMQRLYSSHLWGWCMQELDAWEDGLNLVGLPIDNPLEGCSWLETANQSGIPLDSPNLNGMGKHVEVNWYGRDTGEIDHVTVQSGYLSGDVRLTIRVTFDSKDEGVYKTGSSWLDPVTLETENISMKNGNTALLIEPQEEKNYCSAEVYFVQDGLLYHLRVVGSRGQEADARETLERALAEFLE